MREPTDIEKEFENNVIWTLKEIKKEFLATPVDAYVRFEYQRSEGAPSVEDQRRAIYFLKNEKAVKIDRKIYPFSFMLDMAAEMQGIKPIGYYLEIQQPKFDEIFLTHFDGKGPYFVFEKVDKERGVLYFASTEIEVSKGGKETYPLQLLLTLQKDAGKQWFTDEVLTDWGYSDEEQARLPKNRVYHAAQKVNGIVAQAVQVKDFIEHSTEKFRINPLYLKSS
jgi:hypothetical protein